MLPVLVDLKVFKIYTFGIFLLLAFFWSLFLVWKNAHLTSYKEETIFDGIFLSLFGGILGGRLAYVGFHFNQFQFDVLKFILVQAYPGISLYGAIAGFALVLFLFLRAKKIKFLEASDYIVPAAFLAIAIGKLGSFFSGVEVGSPTKFFIAIKYANFDGLRHLTSFYESIFFFVGAVLSYRLLFLIRKDQFKKGTSLFFFFWFMSFVYILFDPLKSGRVLLFNLSVNMMVSAILLLTFTSYFLYYMRIPILKRFKKLKIKS